MIRFLQSTLLIAAVAGIVVSRADAATNQAVLNVSITVVNNCDVLTQPATLTMTYSPLSNLGTQGTSSYTYACTNGASAAVTPSSPNVASGSNWEAKNGANNLLYLLYNSTNCSSGQLTNGTAESLGTANGTTQTYNICGTPNTASQQTIPAGTYTDTVTFTFNFGP